MPTNTYTPISTTTLGADTNSITVSSIPQTYKDLVVVNWAWTTDGGQIRWRFNGDSGTNYQFTGMRANSGQYVSPTFANQTSLLNDYGAPAGNASQAEAERNVANIFGYSDTDKFKTVLTRNNTKFWMAFNANYWASTAAITSITFFDLSGGNIKAGSTFTIFGVL